MRLKKSSLGIVLFLLGGGNEHRWSFGWGPWEKKDGGGEKEEEGREAGENEVVWISIPLSQKRFTVPNWQCTNS